MAAQYDQDAPKQMTVIELTGLPGSGKSYLIDSLRSTTDLDLDLVVKPGEGRIESGLRGRLWLFMQAPLLGLLVYLTLALRARVGVEQFRRVHYVHAHYVAMCEPFPVTSKVLVVDEGMLHGLYSCLFGTVSTFLSRTLLRAVVTRCLRNVRVVMHLDIDKEQCVRNFTARTATESRFSVKAGVDEIAVFVHDETYEELLEAIRLCGRTRVLVCRSVGEAIDRLRGEVAAPFVPEA